MTDSLDLDAIKKQLEAPFDEAFFDTLCTDYLSSTSEKQEAIRNLFRPNKNPMVADRHAGLYMNYLRTKLERLRQSQDPLQLRLALAAACIENYDSADYRDTLTQLAELFVAAEQAGIDPKPQFKEISRFASEKSSASPEKMRATLANFHSYAVLTEIRKLRQSRRFGKEMLTVLKGRLNAEARDVGDLFDELCPYYLAARAKEQAEIRQTFRKASFSLLQGAFAYMRKMLRQFRETQDVEHLRNALAAACIEDARLDYRQTLKILAEFYIAAEQLGIPPMQHFAAIADFASGKSSAASATEGFFSKFRFSLERPIHYESSPIPMRDILLKFETNPVLKEAKKPKP